jgi:hypothetical protein
MVAEETRGEVEVVVGEEDQVVVVGAADQEAEGDE